MSSKVCSCNAGIERLALVGRRPAQHGCTSRMPAAQGAAGQGRRGACLACGCCTGGGAVGEGPPGQAGLQVSAAGRGGGVVRQAQAAHGAVQRGQPAVVLAAPAHPAPTPLGLIGPVQTSFVFGQLGAHTRAAGTGAARCFQPKQLPVEKAALAHPGPSHHCHHLAEGSHNFLQAWMVLY